MNFMEITSRFPNPNFKKRLESNALCGLQNYRRLFKVLRMPALTALWDKPKDANIF